MTALYFGTWERSGHYLFMPGTNRPSRNTLSDSIPTPWGSTYGHLDRAPKWRGRPGRRMGGGYGKQGDAVLRHKDGWTWLAVADYSVDSRGNSHSSFVFSADLTFEQALEVAREHFPEVVARVGEIREVPGGD